MVVMFLPRNSMWTPLAGSPPEAWPPARNRNSGGGADEPEPAWRYNAEVEEKRLYGADRPDCRRYADATLLSCRSTIGAASSWRWNVAFVPENAYSGRWSGMSRAMSVDRAER